MADGYTIKLPIFEGPLDLLLHLIKVNEMEISEVSISAITAQYLDTIRLMEQLDLEVAGDFLVMAATLLNIKLRSLLPNPEEEVEEEAEEMDDFMSARLLMQKLVEYRRFKEAAQQLGHKAEHQTNIFMRDVVLPKLAEAEADDLMRGDLRKLLEAFSRVLKFVDRRNFHQVQEEEYTVDIQMDMLKRRLSAEPRLVLSQILTECEHRVQMVVTVLALLEMCRQKQISISQTESFGEVLIFRKDENPDLFERSDEAAEIERIEEEIAASRTGVLDDGILPDDEDEDAMIDQALAEAAQDQVQTPPAETLPAPQEQENEDELEEDIQDFEQADVAGEQADEPADEESAKEDLETSEVEPAADDEPAEELSEEPVAQDLTPIAPDDFQDAAAVWSPAPQEDQPTDQAGEEIHEEVSEQPCEQSLSSFQEAFEEVQSPVQDEPYRLAADDDAFTQQEEDVAEDLLSEEVQSELPPDSSFTADAIGTASDLDPDSDSDAEEPSSVRIIEVYPQSPLDSNDNEPES